MARLQRRYVRRKTYRVKGASKFDRKMKFVGRLKIGGREYLVFLPRKVSKFRRATRRRRAHRKR